MEIKQDTALGRQADFYKGDKTEEQGHCGGESMRQRGEKAQKYATFGQCSNNILK